MGRLAPVARVGKNAFMGRLTLLWALRRKGRSGQGRGEGWEKRGTGVGKIAAEYPHFAEPISSTFNGIPTLQLVRSRFPLPPFPPFSFLLLSVEGQL